MKWSEPMLPLPTLPGKVHGIVGINPLRVQCDGCGRVVEQTTERAIVLILGQVLFPSRTTAGGRFCPDCRGAS